MSPFLNHILSHLEKHVFLNMGYVHAKFEVLSLTGVQPYFGQAVLRRVETVMTPFF